MNDDLPFRSRGGTSMRHFFPVDGDYVIKLRLRRAFSERRHHRLQQPGAPRCAPRRRAGEAVQRGRRVRRGELRTACIIPPGVQTSSEYSITSTKP